MPEGKHGGWAMPGTPSIHVGYLPRRKQPALYVLSGARIRVLAYFRSEEAADEAHELIDRYIFQGGPRI